MLKLSLGTGFLKRVGQIPGVAELKSGASSLKLPGKWSIITLALSLLLIT